MNNLNYQNPIQELQKLLGQLGNYMYQVNSILTQMNNIINKMNNPNSAPIKTTFMPLSNNINNNNYNLNTFNIFPVEKMNKPAINITFNFDNTLYNMDKINLVIDHDMSIKEMLDLLRERVRRNNYNDILKNDDLIFKYRNQIVDINSNKYLSEIFGVNFFNLKDLNNCFIIYAYQK